MSAGFLVLAAALLLLAGILHQGGLLLVAVLLVLLFGVAKLWEKYALRRVEYSRRVSATRAFFGDEVRLELSVANRKPLPLPWVSIAEELDEALTLKAGTTSPSYRPGRAVLSYVMPLGWYRKVTRSYTMQCLQRGYFSFGPAKIQSGDYFRFRVQEMEVGGPCHLVVYPKIVPLEQLGIPSRDPFGDLRLRRHLFQDPVRVASIREYAYGDPMRRIHWKATARTGQLQTKVFEHTTSPDLAVFLDVRTAKPPLWGVVPQLMETAVITAASIANDVIDKGYRVGLYMNQPFPNSSQTVRLPPSSHPDQLLRILEALAGAGPPETLAIDRLVQREAAALPWVSTLVVVTAVPTAPLLATLSGMHRLGRPVALVIIGGEKPTFGLNGFQLYHVSAEAPWEKVESVAVAPAG